MAKGQSQEISFVVGIFVFLGAFVFLGGLVSSSLTNDAVGTTSIHAPPTPPEDILGVPAYFIAITGYFVTTLFGLSSAYSFITGIIIIPTLAGISYLIMKLIRGN